MIWYVLCSVWRVGFLAGFEGSIMECALTFLSGELCSKESGGGTLHVSSGHLPCCENRARVSPHSRVGRCRSRETALSKDNL